MGKWWRAKQTADSVASTGWWRAVADAQTRVFVMPRLMPTLRSGLDIITIMLRQKALLGRCPCRKTIFKIRYLCGILFWIGGIVKGGFFVMPKLGGASYAPVEHHHPQIPLR